MTPKSVGSTFPRIVPFFFKVYQVSVGIKNWGPLFLAWLHIGHTSLLSTSLPPPNLPRIFKSPWSNSSTLAAGSIASWLLRGAFVLGGKSLNRAAAELRVSAANLSKWEKAGVGSMDPKDKLFKSNKKANLPGPPSQLAVIDVSHL